MAHVTKFKMTSMGQIFAHVNRDKNLTRKYGNTDIDVSKTHLNYDLQHGDIDTLQKRLENTSKRARERTGTHTTSVFRLVQAVFRQKVW